MSLSEYQDKAQEHYRRALSLPPGPEQQEQFRLATQWQRESERAFRLEQPAIPKFVQPYQPYTAPSIELNLPTPKQPQKQKSWLGTLISFILISAIIVFGVNYLNQNTTIIPALLNTEPAGTPPVLSTGAVSGEWEQNWKTGISTDDPPLHLEQEQPSRFTNQYATPEEWLQRTPGNENFEVIITSDPSYNCGWAAQRYAVGGCYDAQYGQTLFLYWDAIVTDEVKEFVLAHEYSHYLQWYDHYDVMRSATQAQMGGNQDFIDIIEADATCRVLSWGGYNLQVANSSSSPCNVTDWSENWMQTQVETLGVTIEDY